MTLTIKKIFPSKRMELVEFFIENSEESFNIKELAEKTNVSESRIKELIQEILDVNLIVIDKKIGKSNLYKINKDSFTVQALTDANNSIKLLGMKNETKP
jgi:DNA-binding transcriptional regulator GbsR (MarR family)